MNHSLKQRFFVRLVSLVVAEAFLCSSILPAWATPTSSSDTHLRQVPTRSSDGATRDLVQALGIDASVALTIRQNVFGTLELPPDLRSANDGAGRRMFATTLSGLLALFGYSQAAAAVKIVDKPIWDEAVKILQNRGIVDPTDPQILAATRAIIADNYELLRQNLSGNPAYTQVGDLVYPGQSLVDNGPHVTEVLGKLLEALPSPDAVHQAAGSLTSTAPSVVETVAQHIAPVTDAAVQGAGSFSMFRDIPFVIPAPYPGGLFHQLPIGLHHVMGLISDLASNIIHHVALFSSGSVESLVSMLRDNPEVLPVAVVVTTAAVAFGVNRIAQRVQAGNVAVDDILTAEFNSHIGETERAYESGEIDALTAEGQLVEVQQSIGTGSERAERLLALLDTPQRQVIHRHAGLQTEINLLRAPTSGVEQIQFHVTLLKLQRDIDQLPKGAKADLSRRLNERVELLKSDTQAKALVTEDLIRARVEEARQRFNEVGPQEIEVLDDLKAMILESRISEPLEAKDLQRLENRLDDLIRDIRIKFAVQVAAQKIREVKSLFGTVSHEDFQALSAGIKLDATREIHRLLNYPQLRDDRDVLKRLSNAFGRLVVRHFDRVAPLVKKEEADGQAAELRERGISIIRQSTSSRTSSKVLDVNAAREKFKAEVLGILRAHAAGDLTVIQAVDQLGVLESVIRQASDNKEITTADQNALLKELHTVRLEQLRQQPQLFRAIQAQIDALTAPATVDILALQDKIEKSTLKRADRNALFGALAEKLSAPRAEAFAALQVQIDALRTTAADTVQPMRSAISASILEPARQEALFGALEAKLARISADAKAADEEMIQVVLAEAKEKLDAVTVETVGDIDSIVTGSLNEVRRAVREEAVRPIEQQLNQLADTRRVELVDQTIQEARGYLPAAGNLEELNAEAGRILERFGGHISPAQHDRLARELGGIVKDASTQKIVKAQERRQNRAGREAADQLQLKAAEARLVETLERASNGELPKVIEQLEQRAETVAGNGELPFFLAADLTAARTISVNGGDVTITRRAAAVAGSLETVAGGLEGADRKHYELALNHLQQAAQPYRPEAAPALPINSLGDAFRRAGIDGASARDGGRNTLAELDRQTILSLVSDHLIKVARGGAGNVYRYILEDDGSTEARVAKYILASTLADPDFIGRFNQKLLTELPGTLEIGIPDTMPKQMAEASGVVEANIADYLTTHERPQIDSNALNRYVRQVQNMVLAQKRLFPVSVRDGGRAVTVPAAARVSPAFLERQPARALFDGSI